MATLELFRNEMAAVLGLDNVSAGDQPMIDQYVNEGVTDVLMKTHCKVLPFELSLTAGEDDYTLDTDILLIIELVVSTTSEDYSIARVTPSDLLRLRLNSSSSSSPSRYYATSGANLLMIYPTPATADTISGIYVPRPTTLTDTSDTPTEIPEEWHKAVSYYALHRLADMDDDASSEMGQRYFQLYQQTIGEMRAAVYKHGGVRMPPAQVAPRKTQRNRDPSVVNW